MIGSGLFYSMQVDKPTILKKLKEIGLAQQEDRVSPDIEMTKVIQRVEKHPDRTVEYSKTIYKSKELQDLERFGTFPPNAAQEPTKEKKGLEEAKPKNKHLPK